MKLILVLVFVAVAAISADALKCYTCTDCSEVDDATQVKTCRAGAHCIEKSSKKDDGSIEIERRCCGQQCPNDESIKTCKICKTDLCNKTKL